MKNPIKYALKLTNKIKNNNNNCKKNLKFQFNNKLKKLLNKNNKYNKQKDIWIKLNMNKN